MNCFKMCEFQFIIVLLIVIGVQSNDPEVKTQFGRVRGKIWLSTKMKIIEAYLGLPYAEPPINDLRFKNPKVWTKKWNDTFDATKNGPPCFQIDYEGKFSGDENCLYLNVFSSFNLVSSSSNGGNSTRKLPVLVFIRGGSFNMGDTDSKFFSPKYLLNEEIVLVTFNYRLNLLGFYSTGNDASPGNYGLKDMVAALKWVKENIANFGGDPNSVTLFGNSAGAAATHFLAISQKTKGLFHKIITMSGSALAPWAFHSRENIKKYSIDLARKAGCLKKNGTQIMSSHNKTDKIHFDDYPGDSMTDNERVECMRKINAAILLNLTNSYAIWKNSPNCIFGPTLEEDKEGAIVTISPREATEHSSFPNIPWMTGVVDNEGLGMYNVGYLKKLTNNFTDLGLYVMEYQQVVKQKVDFIKLLTDYYFRGNISLNFETKAVQLFGDAAINWPVYEALKKHVKKMKSNIYFYHFAYEGTFSVMGAGKSRPPGVAHMDDVNYLFPFLNENYENLTLDNSEQDKAMINTMTKLWTSFAKTGKPSVEAKEWKPYGENHKFMRLGNGSSAEISMENDFLEKRMEFWEMLMKNVSNSLEETIVVNNQTKKSGSSFIHEEHIVLNCLALLSYFLIFLI